MASRVSKLVLSKVGCGVVSSQIFRIPESFLGSVLLLPAMCACTYASDLGDREETHRDLGQYRQ